MLSVIRLRRKPKHFMNFTGLTPEQFDALLEAVRPEYEVQERARKGGKGRRRGIGGGRKFKLALAQRRLMSLVYYRLYVSYLLLGYLFGLDDSRAGAEVRHRMQPVLLEVLPTPMRNRLFEFGPMLASNPDRSGTSKPKPEAKRLQTLEELLKAHPEIKEVLIDATEQEVPRPKDQRKQKTHYSGKQQRHTIKTQVTTSQSLILHVSESMDGSVNDLTLLRASRVLLRQRSIEFSDKTIELRG